MVRAVILTPEQVNLAADALKAEGAKVTARAVRQQLGTTACLGTITKLLQRRKAGQERQVEAARDLPPVLQRAILDFVGKEVADVRTDMDAELTEQQQEAADLANENEVQQEAIETLTADMEALQEELARERDVAEKARTELARAQLRLEGLPRLEEAAEKARMELAKAQFKLEDIPRLEQVAEQSRAELVKMQVRLENMTRLEIELATVRSELDTDRAELADIRVELEEERILRIKAQQFIVDPIFKKSA